MEKRFPRLIQNGKIIPVNCWKSHMHTLIPEKPLRQLYRYTPKWQDRIYQDGILKNSQVTHQFSSVQFSCSVLSDSLRPHESQHTRPPCPLPTPRVYSKLISIELVMPSNHLILCHPLLLLLPTPPRIRVFSSESTVRMRWPKYWSFSFKNQSFPWTPRTDLL